MFIIGLSHSNCVNLKWAFAKIKPNYILDLNCIIKKNIYTTRVRVRF